MSALTREAGQPWSCDGDFPPLPESPLPAAGHLPGHQRRPVRPVPPPVRSADRRTDTLPHPRVALPLLGPDRPARPGKGFIIVTRFLGAKGPSAASDRLCRAAPAEEVGCPRLTGRRGRKRVWVETFGWG